MGEAHGSQGSDGEASSVCEEPQAVLRSEQQ